MYTISSSSVSGVSLNGIMEKLELDLEQAFDLVGYQFSLKEGKLRSTLEPLQTLLYGVSKSNIAKLQRVQNALCRVIFRLDKMSHVTPFLKKLHWLPIQHRILFKYNVLVFKAINLSQAPYEASYTLISGIKGSLLALKEFQNLCLNNIAVIATDNTMVVFCIWGGGG